MYRYITKLTMATSTIKQARENKNLSQGFLAESLGISRPTYSNIEKWLSNISLGQAVRLTSILDLTLDDLLGETRAEWIGNIDREKFKEILKNCISFWSDPDGRITKTKLAKLAYLIDFWWYYRHLESLTGLEYRRIQHGPVSDTYFWVLEELQNSESIGIQPSGRAAMIENISSPDVSLLSEEELSFVKEVCAKWKGKNTEEIVRFTHEQLPWKICRENDIIPYEIITQEDPENVY